MKPIAFIALPLAIVLISLGGCGSNASLEAVHAAFSDCATKHKDFGEIKDCMSAQLSSHQYIYSVSSDSIGIRNFLMPLRDPPPGDMMVFCRRDPEPKCSP